MNINCGKPVLLLGLLLLLLLLLAYRGNAQSVTYMQQFPKECSNAIAFYTRHQSLFETAAQQVGLKPQMLFAIVAPEITQYGYLSNTLETYSLKVLYVQNGKTYADFSVGYFQMKPSFVEQLEQFAAEDTILKAKYAACLFINPNERETRVERVNRLNTVEWQIAYLELFCEVLQKKFADILFDADETQVRFYASAYNCGFHKSEQQIKKIAQKALFPHFWGQKFRYSDIAAWFYQEIMK